MKNLLITLENVIKKYDASEWVTREQLCKMRKIEDVTLSQYITKGKIPQKAIAKGLFKNKLFHLPTLLQS